MKRVKNPEIELGAWMVKFKRTGLFTCVKKNHETGNHQGWESYAAEERKGK